MCPIERAESAERERAMQKASVLLVQLVSARVLKVKTWYRLYTIVCSLVVLVFKGSTLLVFPVFQPHTWSILIYARMCGSVNKVNTHIPWVGEL